MCERCNENNPSRDVFWAKANSVLWAVGPKQDGFCISVDRTGHEAFVVYENINYCPWCGRKLEK